MSNGNSVSIRVTSNDSVYLFRTHYLTNDLFFHRYSKGYRETVEITKQRSNLKLKVTNTTVQLSLVNILALYYLNF